MKTDVVQKAIIFNDHGQILVLRRSGDDTRRPHQCDLPGGELEPGENVQDGLEREIKEETNLVVTGIRPIFSKTEIKSWENNGNSSTANIVRIIYLAQQKSGEVKLSFEHEEFMWLKLEEAIQQFDYPLHKEVLEYIVDNKLID